MSENKNSNKRKSKVTARKKRKKEKQLIAAVILVAAIIVIAVFALMGKGKNPANSYIYGDFYDDSDSGVYDRKEVSRQQEYAEKLSEYSSVIIPANDIDDEDYIKETLFVGDSNTEGISAYGFLPLQYVLGSTGMPIQGVTKTRCIYFYGYDEPVTMATAVGMLKPRRVILSFGTNNAGGTTTKDFIKNYEGAIAAIEKSYPYCDIIVESILPVKKNRSYPDIKKEDIDEFNIALAKMCKDNGYMFLNSAEIFKGKDGYAKSQYFSNDGIHLNTDGYKALLEYVENHKYITKDSRPRRGRIPQRREAPVVSSEPRRDDLVSSESRSVSSSSVSSVVSSSSVRSSSRPESQSSEVVSSSESPSSEAPVSSSEEVVSQPDTPRQPEEPTQDSNTDNTAGGGEENNNADVPAEENPATENETQE